MTMTMIMRVNTLMRTAAAASVKRIIICIVVLAAKLLAVVVVVVVSSSSSSSSLQVEGTAPTRTTTTQNYPERTCDSNHQPEILVSISHHATIFSCFLKMDGNNQDNDNTTPSSDASSAASTAFSSSCCCRGIVEIWYDELHLPTHPVGLRFKPFDGNLDDEDDDDSTQHQIKGQQQHQQQRQLFQQQCQREIALVPILPLRRNGEDGAVDVERSMAQYAWNVVISAATDSAEVGDMQHSASDDDVKEFWWSPGPSLSYDQHHRRPIPRLTEVYIPRNGDRSRSPSMTGSLTVSPYHLPSFMMPSSPSSSSSMQNWEPIFQIESNLGASGGMHRLWHHTFNITGPTTARLTTDDDPFTRVGSCYYLFLTLPSGMFIDLDDPVEVPPPSYPSHRGDTDVQMTKLSSSGLTSSYRISTTTTSYDLHLHAAKICDIEQPAFVSGQHLLVWEVCPTSSDVHGHMDGDGGDADNQMDLFRVNFATKVHLRYPRPTKAMEDWVYLPAPLLFRHRNGMSSSSSSSSSFQEECRVQSDNDDESNDDQICISSSGGSLAPKTTTTTSMTWHLGRPTKVWVATGTDDDYAVVVFATVTACLVGVIVMLLDISKASVWDDV